jgi:hypothetical protein
VEIEVPTDGKEVILDVVNLLLLSKDVHVCHFSSGQLVEGLNQLLLELEGVFVLSEIP